NVFHLTYVENRGAAFGMFQNSQTIFIIVAIGASIVGLYYLYNKKLNLLGSSAILLIISGAIGNLIDRVRLGFVVDYFDFRFIWDYVFNIADIFVVVGTILLCIYIILFEDDK
ncbi:MAG: signal peptidase II, partial [Paraclostridium sp.]